MIARPRFQMFLAAVTCAALLALSTSLPAQEGGEKKNDDTAVRVHGRRHGVRE